MKKIAKPSPGGKFEMLKAMKQPSAGKFVMGNASQPATARKFEMLSKKTAGPRTGFLKTMEMKTCL